METDNKEVPSRFLRGRSSQTKKMNQSDLYSALLAGTQPTTAYTVSPVAVQAPVHLSVTIAVSAMVGVLFAAVYVQLLMVICFGYKLISYQTVLLFDILLWAALRLTLYSFYYYHCCEVVNNLPVGWDWLLVAFPSTLQFVSLAVLVHYFGEVGSANRLSLKQWGGCSTTCKQVQRII